MKQQNGSFLLQALLALTLVIAFMPFFAQKLARRDLDAIMNATVTQIESARAAARIYVRENVSQFPYNPVVIAGDSFADILEPYGLPLGFMARTPLDQNISLIINKTPEAGVVARLEVAGDNISGIRRAELARRLGIDAIDESEIISIRIPLEQELSDIVRRDENNPDENSFLSDLDMGGFSIENINGLFVRNFETESFQTNRLDVFGTEDGRRIRNNIDELVLNRATFASYAGESALSLTRGTMIADTLSSRTIARFGEATSLTVDRASVYEFSMTAGRTGFTGPAYWEVNGGLTSDRISFYVERLDVGSFINAAGGQDVFISPDTLEYASQSGISVGIMRAANVTLRDQTSAAMARGGTGPVIIDVRLGGTSVFPDVLLGTINNDGIEIIKNHADDSGDTISCKTLIESMGGKYNAQSLSQNITCRAVFWSRLEKRIDLKQCLVEGRGGCE